MYKNILVPLDGTSEAEEALPHALELHRLSGGAITLVRVIPSAIEPPALYSMTGARQWLTRWRELLAEAELYLAEIAARPDVAEVRAQRVVLSGDVEETLLELILQRSFDVLVMTTRDRRDPVRWVLGSVADYLVQRAPIPVLLVRQRGG